MSTLDIANRLNKIIGFLFDSESCYLDHAEHSDDAQLKQLFMHLNTSRKKMIEELQNEVGQLGTEPENSATVLGQAHRIYENLKGAITDHDPLVIAKEIRRGESILIQSYQEAIKRDLPQALKDKLMAHLDKIEDDLKAVDKLAPQINRSS